MDRRAVPRDFEFVPKLRRTPQDPLAQSSVSPIAYVTRPHQWKMDKIPPGGLDWLGFYSFWLTHGNRFSAISRHRRRIPAIRGQLEQGSRQSSAITPKFGDSRHEDVQ